MAALFVAGFHPSAELLEVSLGLFDGACHGGPKAPYRERLEHHYHQVHYRPVTWARIGQGLFGAGDPVAKIRDAAAEIRDASVDASVQGL